MQICIDWSADCLRRVAKEMGLDLMLFIAIAVGYDVMFCFLVFLLHKMLQHSGGRILSFVSFVHFLQSLLQKYPKSLRVAENSSSEAVPMCQASLP